MFAF